MSMLNSGSENARSVRAETARWHGVPEQPRGEKYDPYGRTDRGVCFVAAYERAHRLGALFCRLAGGMDPKMRAARNFRDVVWDRTAADILGQVRLSRGDPGYPIGRHR
jgi:hypothetical protein